MFISFFIYRYISGLPTNITEEQFIAYFSQVGSFRYVNGEYKYKIYKDKDGNYKGDATITYEYPESATMAIQYCNNQYWGESPIHVEFAQIKQDPNHINVAKGVRKNSILDYLGEVLVGRGRSMPMILSVNNPQSSKPVPANPVNSEVGWVCPNSVCHNYNYARRLKCFKCGYEKPYEYVLIIIFIVYTKTKR